MREAAVTQLEAVVTQPQKNKEKTAAEEATPSHPVTEKFQSPGAKESLLWFSHKQ